MTFQNKSVVLSVMFQIQLWFLTDSTGLFCQLSVVSQSVLKLVFVQFKKLFQTENCSASKISLSLPFFSLRFNFFVCDICFILCIFVKTMETFF